MIQSLGPRYATQVFTEVFGDQSFKIHTIKNLDEAIDELCKHYAPETLEQENWVLAQAPYFGFIWPSARALCQWLTQQRFKTPQKILEIGCGLALPSLLAARLGHAASASDFHGEVSRFLQLNCEVNHVKIDYHRLDLKDPAPAGFCFDFILASDILYEKSHAKAVAQFSAQCTNRVILTDPSRGYLQVALEEFAQLGFEHRIDVIQTRETQGITGAEIPKEIFLIELTRQMR